jgi:hypothetical protein
MWTRSFFVPRPSSIVFLTLNATCCLLHAAGSAWHGVYQDGPIAVHITPSRRVYQVGDSFRLQITATNTSDRDVLIKRDWAEQLAFYHLRPRDMTELSDKSDRVPKAEDEQVEWPGNVLIATWMDSSDVVRLRPNESYVVNREIRVWTPDDVATFPFRLKLVGIKDYGRKFDMWQGVAWSNPVTLTVKARH